MNWGNLLLVWNFGAGVLDAIGRFLYWIWGLLAKVVIIVENVFRKLAGLDVAGNDLVSTIIESDNVGLIFGNLVGVATALIIFFTIIKIIQDHYKEKDGGNPYKIVFQSFKGMLMFFFVQAAVIVGLQATKIVFNALDAATNGGSASIAGTIFRGMATDANRMRVGQEFVDSGDEEMDKHQLRHWHRLTNSAESSDKYILVDMEGFQHSPSSLSLKDYLEVFPEYAYGIVGSDGVTVTPLTDIMGLTKIGPLSEGESILDKLGNEYSKDEAVKWNEVVDGSGGGSVGYKNDILSGVSTSFKPSINLSWSPIDIVNHGYTLTQVDELRHDINIKLFGQAISIPSSTKFVKYGEKVVTEKSLEESAKQFGFTLSGSVALQGDAATAEFSFDSFDFSVFWQLLLSIIMNTYYTNFAEILVEALPKMPASTNVGPVEFNYLQWLAEPIVGFIEKTSNYLLEGLGLAPSGDEDDDPYADLSPLAEVEGDVSAVFEEMGVTLPEGTQTFVMNSTDHNAGIWVSVNTKSKYLPIVIERYEIDGNFTELWSQLTNFWGDFITGLESSKKDTWDQARAESELLNMMGGKIVKEGRDWAIYKSRVDEYNKEASKLLLSLTENLDLYYKINDLPSNKHDEEIKKHGFENYVEFESFIVSEFADLVKLYNETLSPLYSKTRPTDNYADSILNPEVYLPIIEFKISNNRAEKSTVQEVIEFLIDKSSTISNMYIDNDGNAYRMIDWPAYGPKFEEKLGNVYDMYAVEKPATAVNGSVEEKKQIEDLIFIRKDDGKVPLNFFFDSLYGEGVFRKQAAFHDGYWAKDGVVIDSTTYHLYYDGKSLFVPKVPANMANKGFEELNTQSVEPSTVETNSIKVKTSSAVSNSVFAAAKTESVQDMLGMNNGKVDTELSNEFSKNIVRYRSLSDAAKGETNDDKVVLKDWVRTKSTLKPYGNYNVAKLYNLTADEIDGLMVGADSPRRYLMLTENGVLTEENSVGEYIGVFSYTNGAAVSALYDTSKINYVVGYIGIIAAMGVYMNFAVGLIQRVVKMAVYYALSPLAISFYPFDNGSRFNSQFVQPFYKEAISAFAVIISLNLFTLFMVPLQTAVETVLTGVAGWLVGWLSIVAFVSMLPKISEIVTSVLGAGSISSKSWKSAFQDADKAMTGGRVGKLAKGGLAKAVGGLTQLMDRKTAEKQKADAKKKEKWEEWAANGGLRGKWAKSRLESAKKKSDKAKAKAEKQREKMEAIDKALAQEKETGKELSDKELKAMGISWRDLKAERKIRNQAKKEAEKRVDRSKYESDEEYNKAVKGKADELSNDLGFRQSINRTIKSNRGKFLEGTLVGAAIREHFGPNGKLAQDKNSLIGAFIRMKNPVERTKNQKAILEKDIAYEKAKNDVNEDMWAATAMRAQKERECQEKQTEAAKIKYADQVYKEKTKGMSDEDLYKKYLFAKHLEEGKGAAEALKLAESEIVKMSTGQINSRLKSEGVEQKIKEGMARGLKTYAVAGFSIDFNDNNVKNRIEAIKNQLDMEVGSVDKAQELLKKSKENRKNGISNYAAEITKAAGGDSESTAIIQNVLSNATAADTFEDIVAKLRVKLSGKNIRMHDIEKKLKTGYAEFSGDVLFSQDDAVYEKMLEAYKVRQKGEEIFNGKIGDVLPPKVMAELTARQSAVYDTNLQSTNVASLGYQMNQIIQKHVKNGGSSEDPACVAEIDALKKRMTEEFSSYYKGIVDKYSNDIRAHKISKAYREEMDAVYAASLAGEVQNQREFQINVNMDPVSNSLVINDSKIQQMHASGDYAGAGIALQQLIDGIKSHDHEFVNSLGFDQETVDKLKQWEKAGDFKRLDGIYGLGAFDAANMGSASDSMRGSSLSTVKATVAKVTYVAEQQVRLDKFKAAEEDAIARETQCRAEVAKLNNQISTIFRGEKFATLFTEFGLEDIHGKPITSHEQMVKALAEAVKSVDDGLSMNDSKVQKMLAVMTKFRDKNINYPALTNVIDSFTNGIARAEEANYHCNRTINVRTQVNEIQAMITEIVKKLKPLTGDK